jgi:hypothetical protein
MSFEKFDALPSRIEYIDLSFSIPFLLFLKYLWQLWQAIFALNLLDS